MIRFFRDRRRKREAMDAIARMITQQKPEVTHRMHVRAVHIDEHAVWVEASYLDPPDTLPPLCRLFRINRNSKQIAEHPIEDIVRFEWWAKAPLEYERRQRANREEQERDRA